MTNTIAIPLNKLLAWQGNVRKTDPDKGIDELRASISAHGLLQSLVVRKDKRGKYAVVAGQRRLQALKSLADDDSIEADMPVPCTVIDRGTDATEISLAENVQREAMHPADEFDAFKSLIDAGTPAADVAARFGVTETVVRQRLKLANVSPALIEAYRRGEMTLQHVMALAVTDDHAAQERVWKQLSEWQKDDPEILRDLLTANEVTASDRRVKFVTLEAYEQAGGTIRRDLFSDGDDGVFIDDVVLLENLVAQKLESVAAEIRAQGWKWVEILSRFDYDEWSRCERRHPEPVPLPPEQQQEYDLLFAEREALWEIEDLDHDQASRLDAVEERLSEVDHTETAWPPETLAIAGAVVTLGRDGEAQIHYGYIKREDAPAKSPPKRKSCSAAGGSPALPASLVEDLTAQRSAALAAMLLEKPDVAFAATVHALALPLFYSSGAREMTALRVTAQAASLRRVEGSRAAEMISTAEENWGARLPCNPADLFAWCRAQDADTLRGLLAFCVARIVNGVMQKSDRPDCPRIQHSSMLAEAVGLDMTAWFTPTEQNYFGRVSKAAIIEALCEAKGATSPAWSGMKKTHLAVMAERQIAGTHWLPEPLRAKPVSPQPMEAAA